MPERIVINTGPLIALFQMGALDIVGRLPFHFLALLLGEWVKRHDFRAAGAYR
jgi:hypothetical protein